jgi:hypothetical protein
VSVRQQQASAVVGEPQLCDVPLHTEAVRALLVEVSGAGGGEREVFPVPDLCHARKLGLVEQACVDIPGLADSPHQAQENAAVALAALFLSLT